MNSGFRFLKVFGAVFLSCTALTTLGDTLRRDDRAIDVLKSMSAHSASLDQLVITGTTVSDARLPGGLMVSNPSEVKVTIDRPGSLYISDFDGIEKKEIFFHEGSLSVFSSKNKYYGQTEIPGEIEAAAEYVLEELELEAPVMDLIYRDISDHLLNSDDSIIYLTDKSRIDGTDCHHIAIRGPEIDLQLWVAEGDKPVPRRIMITSKWEGGAPRFVASLRWNLAPDIDQAIFRFTPPKGSTNIGFVRDVQQP